VNTVDFNATAAARRAGYSAATADSIGRENLPKPHIDAAIRTLVTECAQKLDITGERVLQSLAEIAFANVADFLDVAPDGSARLDLAKIDFANTGGISAITCDTAMTEGREVLQTTLKLGNKLAALAILAKHLGLTGGRDHEQPSAPVQLVLHYAPRR
jgi:phage terminase small subunit